MKPSQPLSSERFWHSPWYGLCLLMAVLVATVAVYAPGLSGGFLFDDFPNIVDNHDVQPKTASLATLITAALASPASEFKRPLASLSFALNFLATGLDPYWMKLTNLGIHLLNGVLVFLLGRQFIRLANPETEDKRTTTLAILITAGWLLAPINVTGVLYVVQRMESVANLFVLAGLMGYLAGRKRMLDPAVPSADSWKGLALCVVSLTLPTFLGLLAKETAVMLPLYALITEWVFFNFRKRDVSPPHSRPTDGRIVLLYLFLLVIPMLAGLGYLLPGLLRSETWATRNFTMSTRLMSEVRIVLDYLRWTVAPTPDALSFYHDNFQVSTGLLTPWTTLASLFGLCALGLIAVWQRKRRPLACLGILLFLGSHLLTATILPLELIYEHRNYFASFGVMLLVVPLLLPTTDSAQSPAFSTIRIAGPLLLAGLLLLWTMQTALTASAWSSPLALAQALASRAPQSPRAQYELGRTYVILSQYNPSSPFIRLADESLETAAGLPGSSVLPEQALIFMHARMHLPIRDEWWASLVSKLKNSKPGVQDESSLASLSSCQIEGSCDLPTDRMMEAYYAALSHPNPTARLLATYANYVWSVGKDYDLGERMITEAIAAKPNETAYRISQIRMLAFLGRTAEARMALQNLARFNLGDRLNDELSALSLRIDNAAVSGASVNTPQRAAPNSTAPKLNKR